MREVCRRAMMSASPALLPLIYHAAARDMPPSGLPRVYYAAPPRVRRQRYAMRPRRLITRYDVCRFQRVEPRQHAAVALVYNDARRARQRYAHMLPPEAIRPQQAP